MTRLALVALLLTAAVAPEAHADKATATRAYEEGQRLFRAGDHAGAAARFKAAWAADDDPVYLFNIAQALRLAKDCGEARDYYKQFLAIVPDAPNRAKVEAYLAEVEACAPAPVAPPPPPQPVAPDPTVTDPTPPVTDPPPARTHAGGSRRWLGLGLVGVGLVAAGSGAYFTVRVGSLEGDREALCPAPCTWTDDLARREAQLQRDGDRASMIAITSFAVGGAALATGVVLYLTGRASKTEHAAVVPTRGGAVATLGFAF